MDIKIEGNPGTNNVFQEIHIGTVQNYNPNATTVINNNYGTAEEEEKRKGRKTMKQMLDQDLIDTAPIRKEILNYVSCIRPFVNDEWKGRFMPLWEDILNLKMVADAVYDPGKQQGTDFNRKLVAGILHFLDSRKVYKAPFNAKAMTEALEDDWEHSVRRELAADPSEEVQQAIRELIDEKYNPSH